MRVRVRVWIRVMVVVMVRRRDACVDPLATQGCTQPGFEGTHCGVRVGNGARREPDCLPSGHLDRQDVLFVATFGLR